MCKIEKVGFKCVKWKIYAQADVIALIILEYRVSQGKKLDTRKLKLHPGNLDQRKKVNKNLPTSLTKFFFF